MKMVVSLITLIAVVFSSGCVSYVATSSHNNSVDREALRMELRSMASESAEAYVGFDLLGARGYVGAWKERPWVMAGSAAADLLLAAGSYMLYEELDKDDSTPSDPATPSVDLSGASASIINVQVVGGDGSSASGSGTIVPE